MVDAYKSVFVNELKAAVYTGSSEAQLYHDSRAYYLAPQPAPVPGQDARKNIVLYRAMKPEEYIYLKTYIEQFKNQVDTIYDTAAVGSERAEGEEKSPIEKINAIYDVYKSKLAAMFEDVPSDVVPVGSHLGDFGQVTSGYMNRAGEAERVVVKFVMRKQGEGKLGSFMQHLTEPVKGKEGPPDIIERDHRRDKIGAKWEKAPRFSLNVGTNKWASFMFMYFVDKIEVLNPGAMK